MAKPATALRIGELRKQSHMTQSELAEKIGKGTSTLQKYELGLLEPGIETLTKLSDIFNVSIDYLLGAAQGDMFPEVFKRLCSILDPSYRIYYRRLGKNGPMCPISIGWAGEDYGGEHGEIRINNIQEWGDLDETAKGLEIYVHGFSDCVIDELCDKFPSYDKDGVIKGFKSIEDFLDSIAFIENLASDTFDHDHPKPKKTLYDPSFALETYLPLLSREQKEVLLGAAKVMVQQNTVKDKE